MTAAEHTREWARVHVRWMTRRDRPDVLRIERQSFEYAWTGDDFRRCLRADNCIGMVAEHGDRVVGFVVYELRKNRLHVLNLAVAPPHRRSGVGAQMVGKLVGHGRALLTARARESNLAAHLFLRACGLRAVRVERGFYEDSGEDAFLFALRVPPHPREVRP